MPVPTAEEIARIDASNQLDTVLDMPSQLEDALWRVETAGLESGVLGDLDGQGSLLVCGMGGSAVGGDLARAALGDRLTRGFFTVRGYELPPWATPESVVLCSSYSGNTEETIACYDAASALGARRVVATTGGQLADCARADGVPVIGLPSGLQPRAAVAYMLVSCLEVAAMVGAAPRMRTEIDASSDYLEQLAQEWGPEEGTDSLPAQLAERAREACACIYGAGPTGAVAYRWKTQINENAKLPAFAADLPEADHNEIVGWEGASAVGKFLAIFLKDSDQHPRTRRRIELTAKLIEARAEAVQLESRGKNPLERVLSLVFLGDLFSIYLAVLRGVDPTPVHVIERLKAELGNPARAV
jgi:glucose/mannose-6-phosphate isomerase